jgi:hypothetical protein
VAAPSLEKEAMGGSGGLGELAWVGETGKERREQGMEASART